MKTSEQPQPPAPPPKQPARLKFVRVIGALLLITPGAPAQTPTTSSVDGKVLSEAHLPVAAATVTAVKQGLPPASKSAKTRADGGFQISALQAGTYTLCVEASARGFLDPCQWGLAPQFVSIVEGKSSTASPIILKAGVIAKLRLQDPGSQLNQKTTAGHTPNVLAGVWTAGSIPLPNGKSAVPLPMTFHAMMQFGKDNAGADYQILVPKGQPLNFHITSADLVLGDAHGSALPNNASRQPFQYDTFYTPNSQQFIFTIIGRKP